MAHVACTSRQWCGMATSEYIWAALLQRDFAEQCPPHHTRYKELSARLRRCSSHEYDAVLKLVVIGDSCIGEARFSAWIRSGTFCNARGSRCLRINVHSVGQELFCESIPPPCQAADGILLMYDVASRGSFEKVPKWHRGLVAGTLNSPCMLLCATGQDLAPPILSTEGKAMAAELGCAWVQSHAEVGHCIDHAVDLLVNRCLVEGRWQNVRQPSCLAAPSHGGTPGTQQLRRRHHSVSAVQRVAMQWTWRCCCALQ